MTAKGWIAISSPKNVCRKNYRAIGFEIRDRTRLRTVREFYFAEPVENGRRYQPFAIWLSFLPWRPKCRCAHQYRNQILSEATVPICGCFPLILAISCVSNWLVWFLLKP